MRTTRKRVAVPFLFRADDALGAGGKLIARVYGNEVEGVFTRAGQARMSDANGRMVIAPHSVPRLGVVGGEPALLVEGATTNLCAYSEAFGSWSDAGASVTANSTVAPDGTTTADTLTRFSADTDSRTQNVTFTGSGTKVFSVYLKAGTSPRTGLSVYDINAATNRHYVYVTWSAGVPTLSTNTGAGYLYPVESCGNGWYRVAFSAAGIVEMNTNQVRIFPADTGSGTVYAWGAQAENTTLLSSYVATAAAAVARVTDVLYFPFTLPPQALTVYVKGVERSFPSVADATNAQVYLTVGDNAADPRVLLYREAATTGYVMLHDPATATQTAADTLGTAAVPGSVVELRGVLGSTGTCTLGVTIDGAAESTNGPSTAQALGTAWNAQRLYLHSTASGNNPVNFAYTHVCVALGTKTMAEMRVLAEVG